eukprot:CAMPEP_0113939354 /NCGR_PEP_ID=MMETSP1339-20121228/5694_1 /TAXON_ID=94617 /ORGANISM="Fibrocapsa japonica" /LENGTH=117 /DNA_ID=CAMNT_0000942843 /DNA_START=142 /DNA_END=495 /DNA_ORIENTATION=+ /assembly_acc=CAM_ASM_000762
MASKKHESVRAKKHVVLAPVGTEVGNKYCRGSKRSPVDCLVRSLPQGQLDLLVPRPLQQLRPSALGEPHRSGGLQQALMGRYVLIPAPVPPPQLAGQGHQEIGAVDSCCCQEPLCRE